MLIWICLTFYNLFFSWNKSSICFYIIHFDVLDIGIGTKGHLKPKIMELGIGTNLTCK